MSGCVVNAGLFEKCTAPVALEIEAGQVQRQTCPGHADEVLLHTIKAALERLPVESSRLSVEFRLVGARR